MRRILITTFTTSTLALLALGAFLLTSHNVRCAGAPSDAEAGVLKPGDPAPAFEFDKWLKGEPVEHFEKGKVYVMEFWATWCAPCIESMPELSELQHKYKDKGLVVIAANIWEDDFSGSEPFVKEMGDRMDFRVATDHAPHDSQDGKTAVAWMKAAGRETLPSSFVVDREGKVVWMGFPAELEPVLKQVMDGTFDVKKYAAFKAKSAEIDERFAAAVQKDDYDKAIKILGEAIAHDPEGRANYLPTKLVLLLQKKDYKAANEYARSITDEPGATQRFKLRIAEMLLSEAPKARPGKIDLDLGLDIAQKAVAMKGPKSETGRNVVALAYALKGDYDKAIENQNAAIKAAVGAQRLGFTKDLESIKAAAEASKK